MKKLYTLILMVMAAITATAADWTYMPMVREGVEWHYATQNVRQGGTDTGNIYLRFDGSETVDGKTYSVLYRYDTPAFDKAKAQIAAYMREDGHKVYAICKIKPDGTSTSGNESEERVAYDFDTPENNTFAIVGKVDFITVGNTSHKALSDNSVNHIWAIDGIGIAAEGFTADGYLPFPNPYVVASTILFQHISGRLERNCHRQHNLQPRQFLRLCSRHQSRQLPTDSHRGRRTHQRCVANG